MASMTSLSEAFTPLEEQVNIQLDFHQMLFNYLRLLRFDSKSMSLKHHIKFDKDLFKVPNQQAFHHVVHFLFSKLDGPRAVQVFRSVWPIVDRKQEAEFRKKVKIWFSEIQESNKDTFMYGTINPAIFMSPGGEKFAQLCCALASHIISKMPHSSSALQPPINKNPAFMHCRQQILKGSLLSECESWVKLTSSFQENYREFKELSRTLVSVCREKCQEKPRAQKELCSIVEQTSLSDSQKQSVFDLTNNNTCIELANEIKENQEYLNSLIKDMLALGNQFQDSWNIINSVLGVKKSQMCINGGKLIKSFPIDYIDRYQNMHSGTRLELQKKNGRYDLVPLLNLVLFSTTTANEISSRLNFPPLEDEMARVERLHNSAKLQSQVAEKLNERWSKIFNEQTEAIDRMLTLKFQGNMPMALQSVTPFRNVLVPDKNSAEAATPAVLRAALGMTPIETGAKPKMRLNQLDSGRPSLDLLTRRSTRDVNRQSSGQNGNNSFSRTTFEKPEIRMIDKRRSHENGGSGLELCRKKSLTPEPSRNSSLNRTPIGTLYLPTHTRISRPSSLAASPVVERVLQTESSYGIHTQKQQRARRSLPQQVAQQLEAAGLMTPRMNQNAVWDQAAESIVYDLVRFDSPAAPTHGLIDPNSSFEKGAFVSRNMIRRSPEQQADEEKTWSTNLDLLKVLETKFVSPRRSSLLSRPGSRNSSPLPVSDWMDSATFYDLDKEKGLLDASSASLIDDILDYSLDSI